MHRHTFLAIFLLLCTLAEAKPVGQQDAHRAGSRFLRQQGILKADVGLQLHKTISFNDTDGQQRHCYYVFNHGKEGFVIVGADDRCTPIIGYSTNGSFDESRLPTNMAQWLKGCASDIERGIRANAPDDESHKKQWDELLSDKPLAQPSTKDDRYLLTSTWEQGYGYNKYCPTMNGRPVVVGCVATAMAQIIRFHQYPTRGFGSKTYVHNVYGQQSVNFDTTNYDYSLMPDEVWYGSSDAEIDMVSRLCYHCGIVVNMDYQHAGNLEGSGAHTGRLPEAFRHFGYTDVQYHVRLDINNDSVWTAMIRKEIDSRRPIEYAGYSNDGGHAFVLDGYNSSGLFHFNWGWGGYCDGFYTLTTMQGFTGNHSMATNIRPSGWDGHLERFYVSSDGNGGGLSWDDANRNIQAAVVLSGLTNRDIWVKEGTYYGDTAATYAFVFNSPATIVGGFAGNETAVNQRNVQQHPTIFDGQHRRGILKARINTNSTRSTTINDIILQNGHSHQGSCVEMGGPVNANFLTIRNCHSDSGNVVDLNSARMRMSIIENNDAPTICQLYNAAVRQSLLAHNNTRQTLHMDGQSRVVNCDIVGNTGTGVVFNHKRNTFVNNIVWNNDTAMTAQVELLDTAIRHCAIESDTNFADSTWVRLDHSNEDGPMFANPGNRGRDGLTGHEDYRLLRGSRCINAGERLSESIHDGDLDRTLRCRDGAIDIGCYESNHPVGIVEIAADRLTAYPNPAGSTVTVTGCKKGTVAVYDMSGRLVKQQPCGARTILDISTLPQGVYFLKNDTRCHKIVKE